MQYQSPENNNPANPLAKVAALDLDRHYPHQGSVDFVSVLASLNFKKSEHMSGVARTNDGVEVTVSFSLAIRKASLELVFFRESDSSGDKVVDIKNVAFRSSLAVKGEYSGSTEMSSQAAKSRNLAGSIKSTFGIGDASATAEANISGSLESKNSIKEDSKIKTEFDKSNVNVTFAGNSVFWEFGPKGQFSNVVGSSSYLEGEVFYQGGSEDKAEACSVQKKTRQGAGSLGIKGSVYTSLADLIVDNICFVDGNGMSLSWTLIESPYKTSALDAFKSLTNAERMKEALMKSIIKKHLVSQGMSSRGAMVEICKANT